MFDEKQDHDPQQSRLVSRPVVAMGTTILVAITVVVLSMVNAPSEAYLVVGGLAGVGCQVARTGSADGRKSD